MSLFSGFFGPWNRFRDGWLQGRQAVRMFLVATILVLAITPIWLGLADPARMPPVVRATYTIVAMVGTVATFFLWLGMWRYWVRLDDSPRMAKRVWFVVLLFGFWWGSCLYYLCVYRPRVTGAGPRER